MHGKAIVGVVEVIKKPEFDGQGGSRNQVFRSFGNKIQKVSENNTDFQIGVIPQDECVMMRYLWVVDAHPNQGGGLFGRGRAHPSAQGLNIPDSFFLPFERNYYSFLNDLEAS